MEKNLELWKNIMEKEFFMARQELSYTDNKTIYLLLIEITILSLFMGFIKTSFVYIESVLYGFSASFFIVAICLSLASLFSKKIEIMSIKERKINSYKNELKFVTEKLEKNTDILSDVVRRKLIFFKISAIIFIIAILLTIFVKLL